MFTWRQVGGEHLLPWDVPPSLVRTGANKAEPNSTWNVACPPPLLPLLEWQVILSGVSQATKVFGLLKIGEPITPSWLCVVDQLGPVSALLGLHCAEVLQDFSCVGCRLGVDDRSLERSLARAGCEVHCFDPSLKQPHLQQAEMWLHRLSVDWRDPNPAIVAQRQHANTKKLATILNDFGHRQVDVLKADMESAEWKILENLVLEGVLDSVGQLLLELHLHWAGFEVGGDDPSVVRYWFSVLKEVEHANFRLFHVNSDPAKPHLFLHKNVLNASSAYTLSWVNTEWKP